MLSWCGGALGARAPHGVESTGGMMIGVVVVVSAPDPHQRRTPSNMCFMATNKQTNMGDSSERASELVRVGRVVASGDSGDIDML